MSRVGDVVALQKGMAEKCIPVCAKRLNQLYMCCPVNVWAAMYTALGLGNRCSIPYGISLHSIVAHDLAVRAHLCWAFGSEFSVKHSSWIAFHIF